MAIRIERKLVCYESVTMEAINPQFHNISKEKIIRYMKNNPMPNDPAYSKEDLILDLTQSQGMYTLPNNVRQETIEYIENLLNTILI